MDSGRRGVPYVLVHGVSFDRRMWELVVPELPAGHRSIAYDLRGHGAAKEAAGEPTPVLAADLRDLLDALGIERARISGLSYGGIVAEEFALTFPERLAALYLICTRASPFPPFEQTAEEAERERHRG